jgi:hypothetical protein
MAAQVSLLNCLCAAIPARARVITCEEVFELREISGPQRNGCRVGMSYHA